jgi:hypothetical protein
MEQRDPREKYEAEKERYRARTQSYYRVPAPDACQSCGTVGRVDRHHDDYSRPLDVRFLCRRCHQREHPAAREAVIARANARRAA